MQLDEEIINSCLASPDALSKEEYPVLENLSAAFVFSCLPIPKEDENPEYVYIDYKNLRKTKPMEASGFVSQWNLAWESGNFKYELFHDKMPKELSWIDQYSDKNIYLVPLYSFHKYSCSAPL